MIKKRRVELGLSRLQLARRTGVPLRFIGEFEAGKYQGKEREMALVQAFLRLPSREIPERFATVEDARRTWRVAQEACRSFGLVMPPARFCDRVPCTLLQALAWCRLLSDGAVVEEASPLEFGFSSHGLVDPYNQTMGALPLPLITWEDREWRHLIWPQLRVRSSGRTYRLDGLALSAGWETSRWGALQLDGMQNGWDGGLLDNLGLPLLTADPSWVNSDDWRPYLESLLIPPRGLPGEEFGFPGW
jgi:hypothetical protein